jgi:hypothetical protein
MDDGIAVIGPAHVVEEPLDALEPGFDSEGDVTVQVCEGFGVVHEKSPGRLIPGLSLLCARP